MKLQTTIPFAGFYESLHSSMISDTENQMFSDDNGNENTGLTSALFEICKHRQVFEKYADNYVKSFAEVFKIPSLMFEELKSPREYNFTTDRIFCTIDIEDVKRIHATLLDGEGWAVFVEKAKEMFTSRSGFASFYNPDIETWGELEDWDANQLGCLLAAWADFEHGEEFDSYAEYNLMEDYGSNGYIDNWICEASPGIERLFTIREYLQKRAER